LDISAKCSGSLQAKSQCCQGECCRDLQTRPVGFGRIVASDIIWYEVDERWHEATMRPSPSAASLIRRGAGTCASSVTPLVTCGTVKPPSCAAARAEAAPGADARRRMELLSCRFSSAQRCAHVSGCLAQRPRRLRAPTGHARRGDGNGVSGKRLMAGRRRGYAEKTPNAP
jgi:hypothetical protein